MKSKLLFFLILCLPFVLLTSCGKVVSGDATKDLLLSSKVETTTNTTTTDSNLKMLSSPKKFTPAKRYKVMDVLSYGAIAKALITDYEDYPDENDDYNGDEVLFYVPEGEENTHYNGEIIYPTEASHTLIGTFEYQDETLPVIRE